MERLVNIILRALQLIFAIIVAGITGNYLVRASGISNWHLGRLIYTEVIAALSIVVALVWMIPFPGSSFIKWPMDIVLAIGWFISFGLLVNASLFLPFRPYPSYTPLLWLLSSGTPHLPF